MTDRSSAVDIGSWLDRNPCVESKSTSKLDSAKRALAKVPSWLQVALVAYAVVAVFGLAYLVVSLAWDGLSSGSTAVVAGLVAAPLALGLLWPRLTGFGILGIELTLAQVTVQPDIDLAPAMMLGAMGSAPPEMIEQGKRLIEPEVELVEVNLGDGSHWWSTRLFLLAALAQDWSGVKAFAFVSGGCDRRFIGTATPGNVRRALAKQAELEKIYSDTVQSEPSAEPASVIENGVRNWVQSFPNESGFARRVSPQTLDDALNAIRRPLASCSFEWPAYASPLLVRALILEAHGQYVALLCGGRLGCIVNRHQLATELASRQFSQRKR